MAKIQTPGELKVMKSVMGLDDLQELKKKQRRNSGGGHSPSVRGAEPGGQTSLVESYQNPSDIPFPYNRTIKADKEQELLQSHPSTTQPKPPTYGVVAALYPGLEINQLLQKVKDKGRNWLIDEYYNIKAGDVYTEFKASRLPENYSKNRYGDVLCCDNTRVVLKCDSNSESDYINANYVDGFDHKKAYISTQGPLEHTIKDHWRLLWQENVRVVVMTTKLAEKGRIKCDTYWPLEPLEKYEYGKFKIVNNGIANKGDYQITLLDVTNMQTKEVRKIKHFLFLSWPDYGVPPSANGFLKFLFHVRKAQHEFTKEMKDWKGHPRGPPMVVHCSAGIGRTGTFIAIDISVYMFDATGKSDPELIVRKIRKQRAFSVQMPDQYLFCYLAILEYAVKMGKLKIDVNIHKLLLGNN